MEVFYLCIAALFVQWCVCVTYDDLESMGFACSPKDTCRISSQDFAKRNCECDRTCLLYDDCCVDGPKPPRRRAPKKIKGLTCVPFLPDQGAYAVSTCSATWSGSSDVKNKCENRDVISDPLMSVPATLVQSAVTYSNLYCATCNNARLEDLSLWTVDVTCNSLAHVNKVHKNITQEFIMTNIVRVSNEWGVYHWNKDRNDFFPCSLKHSIPETATGQVRYCRPYMVATCADDWNDQSVRDDCNSYMAVIYIKDKAYRNAHCALCNHISVEGKRCSLGGVDIQDKWLSFTLLLDVNREERNKCPSGKIYDPFFKKCRILMCRLPGHEPKNGKCVQN